MYIEQLEIVDARASWGEVGLHGALGYENKRVQRSTHAISAHAPSRVTFRTGGRFRRFHAGVAINDDVPRGRSHAHFSILADGREVAMRNHVVAGDAPHAIEANIAGAEIVELVARTTQWEYCHSVWIDPVVDDERITAPSRIEDCLVRLDFERPAALPRARDCMASVVSPGWEPLLRRMFESVRVHGDCADAMKVIFAVDPTPEVRDIGRKYDALVIPCRRRAKVNATVKSVLYSAGLAIDAERFVCLDADTLVLAPLGPLFDALSVAPPGSVLACREANGTRPMTIARAIHDIYGGAPRDLAWIMGSVNGEADYPVIVNDGVFAATRDALLTLEGTIRRWPGARAWTDQRVDNWWRNQFIFNLALAHLRCGVEVDGAYNVQLHSQDARMRNGQGPDRNGVQAIWRGRPARILHFNGYGRGKYADWRDRLLERS